ncbi:Ig-like domain-containing protein [Capnocytophaga sp.]|uniref:Ig-like domain-containing protein n=1 Tax=Capnocytophaga sp. TaxID=44737 RepID=UPI0026DAAF87|nr:Ig-like domain-containing protein [Capnocytophaga sp.]MDO5106412.1 Ig-like domain-containing protein [Capnocytophaga sp.]
MSGYKNRLKYFFAIAIFLATHLLSIAQNAQTEEIQSPEQQKAAGLFEKGKWVASLGAEQLTELPVGIREHKNSVEYALLMTKARFTAKNAFIDLYARVTVPDAKMPSGKRELYFGAQDVQMSFQGQLFGDVKLVLLGSVGVRFGQHWALHLQGGALDKETGNTQRGKTYMIVNCEGVKEISLHGKLQVSDELIVPLDAEGKVIPNAFVETDVMIGLTDWNDLLLEVNLPAFAIASQVKNSDKGYFGFSVQNAVLDMSDLRNSNLVSFPSEYEKEGYLSLGRELWRGVYMQGVSVMLPEEFKIKQSDKRIVIAAENLLLDNFGVSGHFSAENIFPLESGTTDSKNGWAYSLDKLSVNLMASRITGGSLSGKLRLPLQEKASVVGYTGEITDEEYLFRIQTLEAIRFDVWNAQAELDKSSYIEMKVREKRFLPKLVLNGKMRISGAKTAATSPNEAKQAASQQAKKSLYLEDIAFQGLTLQTEAPLLSVDYMGFNGKGEQRLAGFPVSIKDVSFGFRGNRADLSFGIRVGLQEDRFSAAGNIVIKAAMKEQDGHHHWAYEGFDVSALRLDNVDVGVAVVSGGLEIMKNDATYGDGFKADLQAKINAINAKVEMNAVFGYKGFRYWGFEGKVEGLRIQASFVQINGFVGGAYYRMKPNFAKKTELDSIAKHRAWHLTPDENVGLGLKAGILGGVLDKNAISIMAVFNMETNAGGGLSRVGFEGSAAVLASLDQLIPGAEKLAQLQKSTTEKLSKIDFSSKVNDKIKTFLNTSNQNQLQQATDFLGKEFASKSPINASMNMHYDFNAKSFHANMEVYVNILNILKGINDSKAGWAEIHISDKDKYIHVGTPQNMVGLKIGFGQSFGIKMGSYFMAGTKVYDSPPPPARVANILGVKLNDLDYMKHLNTLSKGRGFAFGSHFTFETGDMTAAFLYANFSVGLGSDLMLRQYQSGGCRGRTGDIGINGWYANGQVYVFLEGELGIKVKLFFINKNIPIIKAGAATILQGSGPNPYWIRGYLGGYYSLLGGLVEGRFRFKMEFGEKCEPVKEQVLDGMKIITDISPGDSDKNVAVFVNPQATFSLGVGESVTIPEDEGDRTYKIVLDNFELISVKDNSVVAGKPVQGASADVIDFQPNEVLASNTEYKVRVTVSFQEYKGNNHYETVMINGKKAVEVEERTFVTGQAPTYIPKENIEYAYPASQQQNFYRQQTASGYVQLKKGQSYLFENTDWTTQVRFVSETGQEIAPDFTYEAANNRIRYTLPDLQPEQKYNLQIISRSKQAAPVQQQTQTTSAFKTVEAAYDDDTETESSYRFREHKAKVQLGEGEFDRLSYEFRTSKYRTFQQKIEAFNVKHKLSVKVEGTSDVFILQNEMNTDEMFDLTELEGLPHTQNRPLLQTEALLDDSYAAFFKKYIYDDPKALAWIQQENGATRNGVGFPPRKSVAVAAFYPLRLKNGMYHIDLHRMFPYNYTAFLYYKKDWIAVETYYANQGIKSEVLKKLYPSMPKTKYNILIHYVLPGETKPNVSIPYYYEL